MIAVTISYWVMYLVSKRLFVLHAADRKLDGSKFEQHAAKAFQQFKNKKVHEFLDEYLRILSEAGVCT